jgi:hypothetical protein
MKTFTIPGTRGATGTAPAAVAAQASRPSAAGPPRRGGCHTGRQAVTGMCRLCEHSFDKADI